MSEKKNIVIVGAKGMLGRDMAEALSAETTVARLDIEEIDITDQQRTLRVLTGIAPELVINCAAYTDVDRCESEPQAAKAVNSDGPRHLSLACRDLGAKLVHFSTDYVFPGTGTTACREEDAIDPVNVYGRTKWQGECFVRETLADHLIIRTAWLFGRHGKNFVSTILRLAQTQEELKVVNDQIGSPTYTRDLVMAVSKLLSLNATGTFHLTNDGVCSWYDFACEACRLAGKTGVVVRPVATEEFPRPAARPKVSILDKTKYASLTGEKTPAWQDALARYLKEIQSEK